jgi:hypothetical protein
LWEFRKERSMGASSGTQIMARRQASIFLKALAIGGVRVYLGFRMQHPHSGVTITARY